MAQQPIELILVRHLGSLLTTPVFVVDVHGDLVYFNEPAEDVLGIRFVDVRSMRYEDWTTAFRVSQDGVALPEEEIPSLETLVLGGEAVPGPLAARWSGRVRLFNGYGPAEAAVYVAAHRCRPGAEEAPPIGRPIDNARLYVLGPWSREPLPVGVPGELHAGGAPPCLWGPARAHRLEMQSLPGGSCPQPALACNERRSKCRRWSRRSMLR